MVLNNLGICSAYGPFDTLVDAAPRTDLIRRLNPVDEPWTVVRVVEAPTRREVMQRVDREFLNARRAAEGLPSIEEEWAQARQAAQLIAVLRARGLPVEVRPERAPTNVAVARRLELSGQHHLVLWEFDEASEAAKVATHLGAALAAHRPRVSRIIYCRGQLVALPTGVNESVPEVLRQVLGPAYGEPS